MKTFELHCLTGFLGRPDDWQPFLDEFCKLVPDFQKNWQVHCYDPLDWDLSERAGLRYWAEQIEKKWSVDSKHIVIGYSLGGRVSLQFSPAKFHQRFLTPAHRDLIQGQEERFEADQKWAQRLLAEDESEWLAAWNSQEVFKFDTRRPVRQLGEAKGQWAELIVKASLAKQKLNYDWLEQAASSTHWIVGEKDLRYKEQIPFWSQILTAKNIHQVPYAGHGILFDQPQFLAQVVARHLILE